jgi:RND family efflux transporter MFP subunit
VQADATSGTFMFTMMQSDVIRIQLYVPQDEAFGLSPGVDAMVRVPEMPGRAFPGKITRLAEALQPGSRTLLTEIDVPNPDGALAAGTYCTVELQIPRKTPSLIVPSEAIIFNRDGLSVALVERGVARIHRITEVRDLGTTVEVSEGVKEGDQVILNPAVNLTNGQKVPGARGRDREGVLKHDPEKSLVNVSGARHLSTVMPPGCAETRYWVGARSLSERQAASPAERHRRRISAGEWPRM